MAFGKFLDPKNDLAFKRIFGTERNKPILIHFLNDIFARGTNPIEEVTFLKPVQDPVIAAERSSIVDVLCRDNHGNHFIVEMQVVNKKGFEKRAQYYAAKAYIEQRDKGIDYTDLKEVTFLGITDFPLFEDSPEYLSHHHLLNTKTYKRHLKDFSFSFLELPKFMKEKDHLITMVEKWAYFFKHAVDTTEQDINQIIGEDLIMKKAYEELNRFSWTKEALRDYDSVDLKRSGDKSMASGYFEDGIKRGMEMGKKEGKLEIAYTMLKNGLDIKMIMEITKLSQQEIETMKK